MNSSRHSRIVSGYFASIAAWYDFLNHFLSIGQDIYWRKRLTSHVRIQEQALVADLAAGTLDLTREILKKNPGARVLGLDYTLPMLVRGRSKLNFARSRSSLVQADGRSLPLEDSSMDAVTIAFGIRNILPRDQAFREIIRVLKPGGRLCILEFGTGRKKILGGLYNFYLTKVLPLMGRLFSRDKGAYRYLAESIRDFPDEDQLALEMHRAGFSRVFYYPLSAGIVYVHVGQKAS
ncbi:MAG: ubiquinone/menaquinone biosynthesis methyltransferase [Desulfonatronovibrionaceae bacterium]